MRIANDAWWTMFQSKTTQHKTSISNMSKLSKVCHHWRLWLEIAIKNRLKYIVNYRPLLLRHIARHGNVQWFKWFYEQFPHDCLYVLHACVRRAYQYNHVDFYQYLQTHFSQWIDPNDAMVGIIQSNNNVEKKECLLYKITDCIKQNTIYYNRLAKAIGRSNDEDFQTQIIQPMRIKKLGQLAYYNEKAIYSGCQGNVKWCEKLFATIDHRCGRDEHHERYGRQHVQHGHHERESILWKMAKKACKHGHGDVFQWAIHKLLEYNVDIMSHHRYDYYDIPYYMCLKNACKYNQTGIIDIMTTFSHCGLCGLWDNMGKNLKIKNVPLEWRYGYMGAIEGGHFNLARSISQEHHMSDIFQQYQHIAVAKSGSPEQFLEAISIHNINTYSDIIVLIRQHVQTERLSPKLMQLYFRYIQTVFGKSYDEMLRDLPYELIHLFLRNPNVMAFKWCIQWFKTRAETPEHHVRIQRWISDLVRNICKTLGRRLHYIFLTDIIHLNLLNDVAQTYIIRDIIRTPHSTKCCSGFTRAGQPCLNKVAKGDYCHLHIPKIVTVEKTETSLPF